MADLRYSAEIDVRSAQRSLESLKQSVVDISALLASAFVVKEIATIAGDFENLRTTLQILYKDTATGARAFEEIKKFAEESVFSVQDLTETVVKLKTAGIQPTVALLKLFADTSSVAADSVGALKAITDLYARTTAGGLGLEDLNRLADRGIPVFQILADKLGISRLEISKIGQTAEGAQLILRALESGLNDAFGGASQARLGTVNQSISAFKDSLANAADAIGQAGLNKGISELAASMTKLVNSAKPIIVLIGKGLGGALKFVADNLKTIIILVGGLITVLAVSWIGRAVSAFLLLARAIGSAHKSIAIFAGGTYLVSEGLSAVEKEIKKTLDQVNNLNNNVIVDGTLSDGTEDYRAEVARLNQELNKFKAEMAGITSEFERYNKNIIRQINLDSELISQSKLVQDVERARNELYRRSQDEIAKLRLAKSKLTEEEKKQGRAGIIDSTIAAIQRQVKEDERSIISAISRKNQEELANSVILAGRQRIYDITRQLNDLKFEGATMGLTNLGKQLQGIGKSAQDWANTTIQGLANAQNISVEAFKQLYPEQVAKVYKAASEGLAQLTAQAKLNNAEAERITQITAGIERQIDLNRQLADLYDEQAKIGLSSIEQKIYDIDSASRKWALNQIQLLDKARFSVDELNAGYSVLASGAFGGDPRAVERILQDAVRSTERIKAVTEQNYRAARTFSSGWAKAFREYADNATNAAKTAERIFQKTFQGIEDLIVDFAKTGKFNFREFLADLGEELLRSQVRSALASMGQSLGIGGLFGGGGIQAGQGATATNPLFVNVVNGGTLGGGAFGNPAGGFAGLGSSFGGINSGPLISGGGIGGGISQGIGQIGSIVSGASSVWDTVKNVGSTIFDTVSSIGSSIGDFFSGWFADGGTIPKGKFGIVGERGPEFVSGPATVTPMTGSTNVVYNINAVDAMSFKQMIARDPAFIHAVASQGARGTPGRY